MPRKSWRRLAGCFVIELAIVFCGGCLLAADFEYKAGTAEAGPAKALVLADRHGNRAAVAEADFAVTRAVADFVAVQLLKSYDLNRTGLVVRGAGSGPVQPGALTMAAAAALGKLEPVVLRFGGGALSVAATDGSCLAVLAADGRLAFGGCGGGIPVRAPIRSAFQVVEPVHGLLRRDQVPSPYPVQAISFGKQVTILALGGAVPAEKFAGKGMIVAAFSNDSAALPDDARVYEAIRQVLARVK